MFQISIRLAIALFVSALALPTLAQSGFGALGNSDEPVSLSADNGIEWDQEKKIYIANGNAQAAQGDFFVAASKLTAFYNEIANGNPDIHTVVAEGDVFLESGTDMLTGEKVTYKIKEEQATITGNLIILNSASGQLSAKKRLFYDGLKLFAEAEGSPQVSQGNNIVTADKLKAFFLPGNGGNSRAGAGAGQIRMVEARGNVFVTNGESSCRAGSADYDVINEQAVLRTNVRCNQCGNQMVGDVADLDLRTGHYQVRTNKGPSSNGRVYLEFGGKNSRVGC